MNLRHATLKVVPALCQLFGQLGYSINNIISMCIAR